MVKNLIRKIKEGNKRLDALPAKVGEKDREEFRRRVLHLVHEYRYEVIEIINRIEKEIAAAPRTPGKKGSAFYLEMVEKVAARIK